MAEAPLTTVLLLSELSYAWIFNEYPSYQDNRRFVSQETGNLYIAKVEKSDVGNYTCVVTNTVTNHKVLGPPTPLILRNDGEFPPGSPWFCVCDHRLNVESCDVSGTRSSIVEMKSKRSLMLFASGTRVFSTRSRHASLKPGGKAN